MNFQGLLEKSHSKKTTDLIVDTVISDPSNMEELMSIFLGSSYRLTQRSAWTMSNIAIKHPHLLDKWLPELIDRMDAPDQHIAVTRNIIRAFQFMDFPEEYEGIILDKCFKLLNDGTQPIAIKAFTMTVIYNLSKKYPDIQPELKLSIEQLLPYGSAGIKSRGKKILKLLNK